MEDALSSYLSARTREDPGDLALLIPLRHCRLQGVDTTGNWRAGNAGEAWLNASLRCLPHITRVHRSLLSTRRGAGAQGYSRTKELSLKIPVLIASWCFSPCGLAVDTDKTGHELPGGGNQVRRLLVKCSDVPGYLAGRSRPGKRCGKRSAGCGFLEGEMGLGVNLKAS